MNSHIDWNQIDGDGQFMFHHTYELFALGENTAQHVHV